MRDCGIKLLVVRIRLFISAIIVLTVKVKNKYLEAAACLAVTMEYPIMIYYFFKPN